jgi:hypothetical protein
VSTEKRSGVGVYVASMVAILVVWVASAAAVWNYFGKPDGAGTFGDMFGAVNALFSGLAFATLIYAAWMQREELGLQREELQATRAELAGQKEQMKQQGDTLKLQRFENTFFSLLASHMQLVESLRLEMHNVVHQGRECFKWAYDLLGDQNRHGVYVAGGELEGLRTVYERFYEHRQVLLGHYFRSLYHLIKFVKAAPIDNQRQYTSLVRAQLSSYEQAMLFYNCLSEHGFDKFKPLVEEFALLENMPYEGLFMFDRLWRNYDHSAFGSDYPRFTAKVDAMLPASTIPKN